MRKKMFSRCLTLTAGAVCAAALAMAPSTHGVVAAETSEAGPAAVRVLGATQYRQTIADIFGRSIEIGGRFAPGVRDEGLLEVGTSRASIAASSLEQYDIMARSIAAQVVDPQHRDMLISCKPATPTATDDACASKFLGEVGQLLFRRPLTNAELAKQVTVAATAAQSSNDFYAGLANSLASMLISPEFLFRKEIAVPESAKAGAWKLDTYSKASRLSFMLWNAPPDRELLAAAADGSLDTKAGLERQADRMLRSSRLTAGVRALFADMLQLDKFETISKDPKIYPQYTPDISVEAADQTLRTISDSVLAGGDYRDLFTTRKTYLTPLLASIYGVAINNPNGGWQAYEYPEGDPRAGILTQVSFVALHSHPGRTSPTLRGRALREVFLCQRVPDPPGDVDFKFVDDTSNPTYRTARARLSAHAAAPACAGCHKMTDPLGLSMEQFDSSGAFRTVENETEIDVSGDLNGKPFKGAAAMGQALKEDPALPACIVRRVLSYGVGRRLSRDETAFLNTLTADFSGDKYSVKKLMRRIVTDPQFYRVAPPEVVVGLASEPSVATKLAKSGE